MLKKILPSCQYVVDNSKDVKINYKKLDEFAQEIRQQPSSRHWLQGSPLRMLDFDTEVIVNLLLVFHAMGFSFWGNPKWTISTKQGDIDGSFALLFRTIEKQNSDSEFFKFKNLRHISTEQLAKLLEGNIEIPLFKQRLSNLRKLATVIEEEMSGSFYQHTKEIANDVDLFELIVKSFDFLDDQTIYNQRPVYFYKLAQLLTSDVLRVRLLKEDMTIDYSHLVGCADYKIPQLLRALEIIEFSQDLARLVDSKTEIASNSPQEIEIRANTIVAINEISHATDNQICPMDVNDLIWLKSQDKSKKFKPYHLTRSVFY